MVLLEDGAVGSSDGVHAQKRSRVSVNLQINDLRRRLDCMQQKRNQMIKENADRELAEIVCELEDVLAVASALKEKAFSPTVSTAADALVRVARDRLILLLLQAKQYKRGTPLLVEGGYLYRLSDELLLPSPCTLDAGVRDAGRERSHHALVGYVDDALPEPLFNALQGAFDQASPFWHEHRYWSSDEFFSYELPLATSEEVGSQRHLAVEAALLVSEIARVVALDLIGPCDPFGYAEWWCHSKPYCAGHPLHFDQGDDAQVPLISTVLYLSPDNVGGPTVVSEQRMTDEFLAPRGWLCRPKANRLLLFDGALLHGVAPGSQPPMRDEAMGSSPHRRTLMVVLCRERPRTDLSSAGCPMPVLDDGRCTWHRQPYVVEASHPESRKRASASARLRTAEPVVVWADVECAAGKTQDRSAAEAPPLPAPKCCFQGITPWRDLPSRLLEGDVFE